MKYYYYVIYCDNADENWLHYANQQNSTSKRTMKRSLALIIAHNLQKKCDSDMVSENYISEIVDVIEKK